MPKYVTPSLFSPVHSFTMPWSRESSVSVSFSKELIPQLGELWVDDGLVPAVEHFSEAWVGPQRLQVWVVHANLLELFVARDKGLFQGFQTSVDVAQSRVAAGAVVLGGAVEQGVRLYPALALERFQASTLLEELQGFPKLFPVEFVHAVLEDLRPLAFELLRLDVVHGLHLACAKPHVSAVALVLGHLFNAAELGNIEARNVASTVFQLKEDLSQASSYGIHGLTVACSVPNIVSKGSA